MWLRIYVFIDINYLFEYCYSVLICVGSYYCYDNPAALTETFIRVSHKNFVIILNKFFTAQVMNVDFSRYNLMYSLYSWPNVILSLIGGVLIDRYLGVRIGTVVFSLFVTFGQVRIFAVYNIIIVCS